MQLLIFDTETTGIWHKDLPLDHEAQPHLVQLAAILADETGKEIASLSTIVRPEGWLIPQEAALIHGITDHRARASGIPLINALATFSGLCSNADVVIGHNLAFDLNIMERAYHLVGHQHRIPERRVCTMLMGTPVVKLPSRWKKKKDPYKWPNLQELHLYCFKESFDSAHNAQADTQACLKCYFQLKKEGVADVVPVNERKAPLSKPTKNAHGIERTFDFLNSTITTVEGHTDLTGFEKDFVDSKMADLKEYGERIMLTEKQWRVVERLYFKFIQPNKK